MTFSDLAWLNALGMAIIVGTIIVLIILLLSWYLRR